MTVLTLTMATMPTIIHTIAVYKRQQTTGNQQTNKQTNKQTKRDVLVGKSVKEWSGGMGCVRNGVIRGT